MAKQSKVDYQKGLIYCIWYDEELFYVGSTTNLTTRKRKHKEAILYETLKKLPVHKKIIELEIPFEDLRFEEYCKVPCNSKADLTKQEGDYQRLLKPLYNIRIEGRSKKDWSLDNDEKVKEQKNRWYEKNKELLKERGKQYYKDNKEERNKKTKEYYEKNRTHLLEKGKEYSEKNKQNKKDYDKAYAEQNKEKIKEQQKLYYEQNKDKLKEVYMCMCGSKTTNAGKRKHEKTLKHQQYIEKKSNDK
jgi:hypothetical protein